MELKLIPIEKPENLNVILGQAHFIKTVEDLHEALVTAVPGIRFGLAFSEASGKRLVRRSGTDPELVELAVKNPLNLACRHPFRSARGIPTSASTNVRGTSRPHLFSRNNLFEA